jgi:hypothetical protein
VLATTATSSRTKAGCNACPVAASADDAEGADNEELEVEEAEEDLLEVEALGLRIILDESLGGKDRFLGVGEAKKCELHECAAECLKTGQRNAKISFGAVQHVLP